ncbi:relaxase/mobilization nuclease domain-containing protein [Acinetobacter baumannii]
MIVKILGNKGGGSAGAAIDYMLGKERDREGAVLLSGDPDLTARLADNLDFQNRYTVGVLSFEEANIEEQQKQEIMQSFEKTLLAGLDRDQYDITWIEHTDKGRLELNFVIPNVELSTGKRLQPYFDQADRPLVENWKQVTNFNYGLSDPHAPDKAQAIKTLNSQNLPENIKEIKQQIGTAIAEQISNGNIQNRQDVVNTLENAGFEITRQTERSISIKNPDGKRNIRLEGVIYENRQFDKQFAEEHSRAGQDYQRTSRERYETALGKLHSLVESKQRGNQERFEIKLTDHQRPTTEHQKRFAFEYSHGSSFGRTDYAISRSSRNKPMVGLSNQGQEAGISRDQSRTRPITTRKADFEIGGISREQGQEDLFHRSQEQQKSGSIREYQRPKSNENREIGNQHDQRLYESLQRHLELVRDAIERAKRNKSKTDRADRSLERSESSIESAERGIEQSKSTIKQSEQQITRAEQRINEKMKEKQAEIKADRGFYR